MKFNKDDVQMGGNYLDLGVHLVSFDDIDRKTTKTGREMWVITLKDDKGATTRYNMVDTSDIKFKDGQSSLDASLGRLLYSISDAGFTIPDVDFTFDNIDQFLASKPYKAYINIRPQKDNPQYNETVFISKEQFEKAIERELEDKGISDTPNPFAGGTEVTDNPFA